MKDYSKTFDGVSSQHDGKDTAIIGTLARRGYAASADGRPPPSPCLPGPTNRK